MNADLTYVAMLVHSDFTRDYRKGGRFVVARYDHPLRIISSETLDQVQQLSHEDSVILWTRYWPTLVKEGQKTRAEERLVSIVLQRMDRAALISRFIRDPLLTPEEKSVLYGQAISAPSLIPWLAQSKFYQFRKREAVRSNRCLRLLHKIGRFPDLEPIDV